jgi:hypothetical protein
MTPKPQAIGCCQANSKPRISPEMLYGDEIWKGSKAPDGAPLLPGEPQD